MSDREFFVWWHESGWKGESDMDAALEAYQAATASMQVKLEALEAENARMKAALEWMDIETAPKRKKVIVCYKNRLGNHRTVMACYYPPETLESEFTESGFSEEGWFEECESQEIIYPVEEEPTHWMPLPEAPIARDALKGE